MKDQVAKRQLKNKTAYVESVQLNLDKGAVYPIS